MCSFRHYRLSSEEYLSRYSAETLWNLNNAGYLPLSPADRQYVHDFLAARNARAVDPVMLLNTGTVPPAVPLPALGTRALDRLLSHAESSQSKKDPSGSTTVTMESYAVTR